MDLDLRACTGQVRLQKTREVTFCTDYFNYSEAMRFQTHETGRLK